MSSIIKAIFCICAFNAVVSAQWDMSGSFAYNDGSSVVPLRHYQIQYLGIYYDDFFEEYDVEEIETISINNSQGAFTLNMSSSYLGVLIRLYLSDGRGSGTTIALPEDNNSTEGPYYPYHTNLFGLLYNRAPNGESRSIGDITSSGTSQIIINDPTETAMNIETGAYETWEDLLFPVSLGLMGNNSIDLATFISAIEIMEHVHQSYNFVTNDEPGLTVHSLNEFGSRMNQLLIYYDPDHTSQVFSSNFTFEVNEQSGMVLNSTIERYPGIIHHEYGHHVHLSFTNTDLPNAGGYHILGRPVNEQLAFSEGWASFFSSAVLNYPVAWYPSNSGDVAVDFETFSTSMNTGSYEGEFNIAQLLWDMFDTGSNDFDHDGYSTSLASIWNAMVVPINTGVGFRNPLNILEFFYNFNRTSALWSMASQYDITPIHYVRNTQEINTVVGAAADGDIVYVFDDNGAHADEEVYIRKDMKLQGAGSARVEVGAVRGSMVGGWKVDGFTVDHRVLVTGSPLGDPPLDRVTVTNNVFDVVATGLFAYNSDLSCANNLFLGGGVDCLAGQNNNQVTGIYNNTFSHGDYGVYMQQGASPDVYNNIMYDCYNYGVRVYELVSGNTTTLRTTYNCANSNYMGNYGYQRGTTNNSYTSLPGTGNISSNPLLEQTDLLFTLKTGSPCIDAGMYGRDRDDTQTDMGVFGGMGAPSVAELGLFATEYSVNQIALAGSYQLGNTGVTLALTSLADTFNIFNLHKVEGTVRNFEGRAIDVSYKMNSAAVSFEADLSFSYQDLDLSRAGIADEADLIVYKSIDGGLTWIPQATEVDAASNTVTAVNQTKMGIYAIGISNSDLVLDDFDDVSDWSEVWGYNVGAPPSGHITLSVSEMSVQGEGSMAIAYMFDDPALPENVRIKKELGASYNLSEMDVIGFWLYGDGSNVGFQMSLGSDDGTYTWRRTASRGTLLNWIGWKRFDIPLSEFEIGWPQEPSAGWSEINYVKIILTDNAYGGCGSDVNVNSCIYIDDLEARKLAPYVVLENFEGENDWFEVWGYNVGSPGSGQVTMSVSGTNPAVGTNCGQLEYIFDDETLPENVRIKKEFSTELNLNGYSTIGFWLYGDALSAGLQLAIGNSSGELIWKRTGSRGTIIDFNGWQRFEIPISEFQESWPQAPVDGVTNITYMKITMTDNAYGSCGSDVNIDSEIFLDDVLAYNGAYPLAKEASDNELQKRLVAEENLVVCSPNPFFGRTAVTYEVEAGAASTNKYFVKLDVFSVTGHHVRNLIDGHQASGTYTVAWDGRFSDGRKVEAGTYVVRSVVGDKVSTRQVMVQD